jgi:hypothetical protein
MTDLFMEQYQKFTWEKWPYLAGGFQALKKTSPPIPAKRGVYLIRNSKPICRVRGSSDIMYIGQSGGGLRAGLQGIGPGNGGPGRLFNTRGPDEWVRKEIEKFYPSETCCVECYFTSPAEDPRKIEESLLRAYLKTHLELPPANHQSVDPE